MQVGLKTSEICKYFSLQASHGSSIRLYNSGIFMLSAQQSYLYAVYTTKLLVCCLHNRGIFILCINTGTLILSIQHGYFYTKVLVCCLHNTGTFILCIQVTTQVLLYCLYKLQHRYFYAVYTTQVLLWSFMLSLVYNTDTFMLFVQQMYFYAVCTTDVLLSVQQRYIWTSNKIGSSPGRRHLVRCLPVTAEDWPVKQSQLHSCHRCSWRHLLGQNGNW